MISRISGHLDGWQNESRKTEHRTVIVFWVCAADVGTDMPKFIKVGEVQHPQTLSYVNENRLWSRP